MTTTGITFATPDDAEALAAIYRHYVTSSTVTFETEPPPPEEMARRIRTISAFYPYLVYRDADRILGYAYAARYHERDAYRYCATLSAYLHPDARGKGLGKRLYRSLLTLLQEQGLRNLYAVIALPNPESVRLQEAFGFTRVGLLTECGYKFGRWIDVVTMEKKLTDSGTQPAPLIPVEELDKETIKRSLEYHAES